MAQAVLMPKAGISVESCIITEWLKKPGDTINKGDILFSYETDKASFECESTESGILLETFYNNGDEVPVLVNVCAIGNPGDDVSALKPAGDAASSKPDTNAEDIPAVSGDAKNEYTPPVMKADPQKISPRARHLADRLGADVRLASPTGPYGRIIERDIRTLANSGGLSTKAAYNAGIDTADNNITPTGVGGRISIADISCPAQNVTDSTNENQQQYEDIAFTGIRRAISKSMSASLSNIPQLTHNFSFDATQLLEYRNNIKRNGDALDLPNITLNDMILFAVSRIILKYPDINSHMLDSFTLRRFSHVNLGIAVDTPRGLLVPVIKYADKKSLEEISAEAKILARRAQDGTISPDEMSGGTFTVSNLGILGVESFTPVINPPQTGILGVNNIIQRPIEIDGKIQLYPAMGISLTYDHRAIDGAPASKFASELCKGLENFQLLLAR